MLDSQTTQRRIVLLLLTLALAGCSDTRSPSDPTSSSPEAPASPSPPAPPTIQLAIFIDPASGLKTTDVHDVHEQVVNFNGPTGELIWTATDTRFQGYPVRGDLVLADTFSPGLRLQVRFGTKNGKRQAYLTWHDDYNHYYPETLADIEVTHGKLIMKETSVPVPAQ